jgi:hypothetical protein
MKQTCHKALEIWEITDNDLDPHYIKRHWYTKNGWQEEPKHGQTFGVSNICSEVQTVPIKGDYYFETFELAYCSKILLLQEMERKYKLGLEKLRVKLGKNVPDVQSHLKDIRDNYPEYLI